MEYARSRRISVRDCTPIPRLCWHFGGKGLDWCDRFGKSRYLSSLSTGKLYPPRLIHVLDQDTCRISHTRIPSLYLETLALIINVQGRLGWLLSFFVSFVVYYVICLFWPTRNQRLIKELGLGWEEASGDIIFAEDGTEIVEEGKTVHAVGEISDDGVGREEYGIDAKY